jgi:hypothetical protein
MRHGHHVCQVYEDDDTFLDQLAGYIGHGLWNGEAAVVIATAAHSAGLEARLRSTGLDLAYLRADDRLITLDPQGTLAQFMIEGWPDRQRFDATIGATLARARREDRPVRAFGEMVGLLWADGHYAATVRLEALWQDLVAREAIQVLCSYPRSTYMNGPASARAEIAAQHTHSLAV